MSKGARTAEASAAAAAAAAARPSKAEENKPLNGKRKGRGVLGDATNRSNDASSSSNNDEDKVAIKPAARRRSARLSKENSGSSKEAGASQKQKTQSAVVAAPTQPVRRVTRSQSNPRATTSAGAAEAPAKRVTEKRKLSRSRSTTRQRSSSVQQRALKRIKLSDANSHAKKGETQPRGRSRSRSQQSAEQSRGFATEASSRSSRSLSQGTVSQRASSLRGRSRTKQRNPSAEPMEVENICYELVPFNFDASTCMPGISEYDVRSCGNVLEAPEYVTDIFQRLFEAETRARITPYMNRQAELKPIMRSILVDWLVEVHKKFVLVPDTLYLTVSIIDRYLSLARVSRSRLQLVGISALLIASKYEEIYPPEVKDCVYTTDRAYTRQDVLDMETSILQALGFRISGPTAYPFLVRFLFVTQASQTARFAASYYLERFLQEYEFLDYRPSLVAAAAVCLALNHPDVREYDGVNDDLPGVPNVLLKYTGFSLKCIAAVANLIGERVAVKVTTSSRTLKAVYAKYDTAAFEFVSSEFSPPKLHSVASRN